MNDYTFSTLNDKEFELLTLDLLNSKFKMNLQSFKNGKDKGIDLRYSSPESDNDIVVQVKHYVGSKYSNLKSKLKLEEFPKVKNLKPTRYIVVTSLKLIATEKDEIKNIFSPYILSSNDVIGAIELNNYIREFDVIEQKHYKLWFSSVTILKTILNNAIEGRTKAHLNKIKSKVPYYVVTENFVQAKEILDREKILLISGDPGVGKTTLADMLLFDKAKEDFKIYKVFNIREAEDIISTEEEKQVFYFDDFLGEVYYEVVSGSQRESEIRSFVERILHTDNKYIILTTRTVILNQAKIKSENIRRSDLEVGRYEIQINDYSQFEKAKILYNHLYHNFQNKENILFKTIVKDKFYIKIIDHDNYNPRIVEFITNLKRIRLFDEFSYKKFILANLTEPEEIWKSSFENQISYLDRCLLLTMFIINRDVNENLLIEEVNNRFKFEIDHNNISIESEQFERSISMLLEGFISASIDVSKEKKRYYSFINPSLADYILSFLKSSSHARKSILKSIVYIEHLHFFHPQQKALQFDLDDSKILLSRFIRGEFKTLEINKNRIYASYITKILQFCGKLDIDELLFTYLLKIDFSENLNNISHQLNLILFNIYDFDKCNIYIKDNFYKIIIPYIKTISDEDELQELLDIFLFFEQDYNKFISIESNFEMVYNLSYEILENFRDNIISDLKREITDIQQLDDIFDELNDLEYNISNNMFPSYLLDFGIDKDIDEDEWLEAIFDNLGDVEYYEERKIMQRSSDSDDRDSGNDIDDLFN